MGLSTETSLGAGVYRSKVKSVLYISPLLNQKFVEISPPTPKLPTRGAAARRRNRHVPPVPGGETPVARGKKVSPEKYLVGETVGVYYFVKCAVSLGIVCCVLRAVGVLLIKRTKTKKETKRK